MANIQLSMSNVCIHKLRAEMLSELASKLVKAGSYAKEKSTKDMVAQLKDAAKEFNDAKTKEKTNQSTQVTQQYLEILKKRYTALGGCITTAKNCGIAAKESAAANIIPKYSKITSVFGVKGETIGRVEKAIANLRTIKEEDLETIGASELVTALEETIEEYRNAVISRVDIKVEKSKAVITGRDNIVKAIQNLMTSIKYAQDCLGGKETELVKSYNTIFAETAITLKQTAKSKKE